VFLVVVSKRLDYTNSILYGVTQRNLERLRRVGLQCTLARVVVGPTVSMLYDSDTLLRNLHRLPVKWRIDYKLAMLTFKARSVITALTYLYYLYLCNLVKSHSCAHVVIYQCKSTPPTCSQTLFWLSRFLCHYLELTLNLHSILHHAFLLPL